jgi:hypothetical protein
VPSLDLRFADNKSLTDAVTGASLVTFTRASSGTFVGSDGVLQTAATDVPRFDHNPTTGESLGLLVEEQRSNLLLHNRTLTDAAWTATNVTAAKDQVGIDGVSSGASSITATDANGTILQAVTSASAARATSAYVKRITGTGTIEMTQNGGTTWTAVTVTSEYTRVTISSATVTNPSVGFRIVTNGDAIAVDYVQLETGAFSTSAIETTTATVTRSADVASITGSAFSSWYRQDEGTVFADANSPTTGTHFTCDDGTVNTNRVVLYYNTATDPRLFVASAGATSCNIAAGAITSNSRTRLVGAYKLNDFAASVNGLTLGLDALGNTPTGVDRARIGRSSGDGGYLNGCLRRIVFWPQRLANSTLQTLTQ